ncbi:hypothetical protein [Brevibacillus choshinensis]|uniref:hypothetical protein n=1 Tax=Brevibacillus choshinensis TaxID=54911 RepID=UPI002E1D8047|nr:hypothetical protein [Brevibacillus choshinensis]MED4755037.1 hypothetical protein [Brevibacillus choshinensis]MED4779583.1 hypothetical protein [Brevibacillus choshinensis]
MKKRMTMIAGALTFTLLLAGCGSTEEANQMGSHGTNHTQGESHAGHNPAQTAPADNLKASFTFATGSAKEKEETEVHVQITDQNGTPVNEFEINHEKLLHLIMVSDDLSSFSHIHPEFKGDGKFAVQTSFPSGGKYKMFADFKPVGGSGTTLSEWMNVEGTAAARTAITPDAMLVKDVDGKEIELSLSNAKANEEVTLTYEIRDGITKKGIQDLEPYLGAVGHVVILSADAEQYLHVHPLDEKATGPKAQFATSFPHSGIYKIWGQFQHKGKVITVPFVVEVK